MRICLLTVIRIASIEDRNLYADLARALVGAGHHVTIGSPVERREGPVPNVVRADGYTIVSFRTLNTQKSAALEKVASMLLIGRQAARALLPVLTPDGCDLLLYATPPVTFAHAVGAIKRQTGARTLLMLKDIFPQNALDLGMLTRRNPLYAHFKRVERRLYQLSDHIGTMSEANRQYVLDHEDGIDATSVSVFPNTAERRARSPVASAEARSALRRRLGVEDDASLFVYGGNLGRPQGIGFLMEVLRELSDAPSLAVVIVGGGTEYERLAAFAKTEGGSGFRLLSNLPRAEYDELVACADVGLIALDHRFTIPNYPSRLLCYLEAGKPVFCITDSATDVGRDAVAHGYGWSATSTSAREVADQLIAVAQLPRRTMEAFGRRGRRHFEEHLSSERSVALVEEIYQSILDD